MKSSLYRVIVHTSGVQMNIYTSEELIQGWTDSRESPLKRKREYEHYVVS